MKDKNKFCLEIFFFSFHNVQICNKSAHYEQVPTMLLTWPNDLNVYYVFYFIHELFSFQFTTEILKFSVIILSVLAH